MCSEACSHPSKQIYGFSRTKQWVFTIVTCSGQLISSWSQITNHVIYIILLSDSTCTMCKGILLSVRKLKPRIFFMSNCLENHSKFSSPQVEDETDPDGEIDGDAEKNAVGSAKTSSYSLQLYLLSIILLLATRYRTLL